MLEQTFRCIFFCIGRIRPKKPYISIFNKIFQLNNLGVKHEIKKTHIRKFRNVTSVFVLLVLIQPVFALTKSGSDIETYAGETLRLDVTMEYFRYYWGGSFGNGHITQIIYRSALPLTFDSHIEPQITKSDFILYFVYHFSD